MQRLGSDCFKSLQGATLRYASDCSGCDAPKFALDGLKQAPGSRRLLGLCS